jgi:hypothetical protein
LRLVRILLAPIHGLQRLCPLTAVLFIELADTQEEIGEDLRIRPGFEIGIGRSPLPHDASAGVGETSFLFGERGDREHKHFRLDLGGINVVEFAVIFPEAGGVGLDRIDADEEFQLRQSRDAFVFCVQLPSAG